MAKKRKKAKFSREYKVFLDLLRSEREKAGMTQGDLAKKLRETQTFVSKCERGERRIDPIEARRYCHAVGLTYPEFVAKLEGLLAEIGSDD